MFRNFEAVHIPESLNPYLSKFLRVRPQCFIPADLTDGRPTDAAFREKLPWFLAAVPSADCAKGGHGAYSHSLDVTGLEDDVIRASEFRTYHTPVRTQTDFVEALRAAREFVDRASERLKVGTRFPLSLSHCRWFLSHSVLHVLNPFRVS